MPALIAAPWLGSAIAGIAGGTAGIVGAKMQSGAANNAANLQVTAANHAADLQAQAAQQALAFQQQAEKTREADFQQTQAQNLNLYNQQLARRQGALGQLMQPIPPGAPQGSIGTLMGGK